MRKKLEATERERDYEKGLRKSFSESYCKKTLEIYEYQRKERQTTLAHEEARKQFEEEQAELRAQHEQLQEQLRTTHEHEQIQLRTVHEEEKTQLRAEHEEEQEELRTEYEELLETARARKKQLKQDIKKLKDDHYSELITFTKEVIEAQKAHAKALRSQVRRTIAKEIKTQAAELAAHDELIDAAITPINSAEELSEAALRRLTPQARTIYYQEQGYSTMGLPEGWRWPTASEVFDKIINVVDTGTKVVRCAKDATDVVENAVNVGKRISSLWKPAPPAIEEKKEEPQQKKHSSSSRRKKRSSSSKKKKEKSKAPVTLETSVTVQPKASVALETSLLERFAKLALPDVPQKVPGK